MPAPTKAGRLGMVRTTGTPAPSHSCSCESRVPAATDSTVGRRAIASSCKDRLTASICCGFTASTHRLARVAASVGSAVVWMPGKSRSSAWRASAEISATASVAGGWPAAQRPAMRARAIWPPPMKATPGSGVADIAEGVIRDLWLREGGSARQRWRCRYGPAWHLQG